MNRSDVTTAELLHTAATGIEVAEGNSNEFGVHAALTSIAASLLVVARADIMRSTP